MNKKSYTPLHANFAALGLFLVVVGISIVLGHNTLRQSKADTTVQPLGVTGNYVLQFDDEFNGTQVDSTKWSVGEPWDGAPGFQQGPEGYCPLPINLASNSLVTESGGYLNLNARPQTINGNPIQTCFITSRGKFQNFTHGYIEAKVKAPAGADLWPAFWLLGNGTGDQGWPKTGEIDMFEFVNNGGDNGTPFYTVHWYDANCNSGHCQKTQSSPYPAKITNYTGQYLTFGLKRTATELSIYINGTRVYGFKNTDKDDGGHTLSTVLFNDPMHIRFDLASGGWADNTAKAAEAGTMQVDYVRAWQDGGATTTPTKLIGDVDGDNHVNIKDLNLLIQHDNQNYAAADFNNTGTVDPGDLAILLRNWTW